MENNLEQYLVEAADSEKSRLSVDNPYRDIGFDGENGRLGWVRTLPFPQIKESLQKITPLFNDKKSFIFVGMGGSINGIKPLLALFKDCSFYTIDSLDPEAITEVVGKAGNLENVMVVSISKSGTTKETQLISAALREVFSNRLGDDSWSGHFLWLSDPESLVKLDSLGWKEVSKAAIQFDQRSDIGGRFSAPHTLIFFLPLFLSLGRDFSKLKTCYEVFTELKPEIQKKAYSLAAQCQDRQDAYFSPVISGELNQSFSSWIVQLFQESLGSKLMDLPVKTLAGKVDDAMFFPVDPDLSIEDPIASLIGQMYFFQIFIAYYSAWRKINFVTQPFVEKYKQQMRMLEDSGKEPAGGKVMNLEEAAAETSKRIDSEYRFLEIVLYFYPGPEVIESITRLFSRKLPGLRVLVFIGSDWNHQSYQAAFGSKDTFYLLLTASSYGSVLPGLSEDTLAMNVKTLKMIAEATYLTIQDKALLLTIPRTC